MSWKETSPLDRENCEVSGDNILQFSRSLDAKLRNLYFSLVDSEEGHRLRDQL